MARREARAPIPHPDTRTTTRRRDVPGDRISPRRRVGRFLPPPPGAATKRHQRETRFRVPHQPTERPQGELRDRRSRRRLRIVRTPAGRVPGRVPVPAPRPRSRIRLGDLVASRAPVVVVPRQDQRRARRAKQTRRAGVREVVLVLHAPPGAPRARLNHGPEARLAARPGRVRSFGQGQVRDEHARRRRARRSVSGARVREGPGVSRRGRLRVAVERHGVHADELDPPTRSR